MPVDRLEVRVSITKLLLSLIIVIVPLSIFGLILTERSDKSLDRAIGDDFKSMAQMYSNNVSQFIHDRVADVDAMAADSAIVGAVSAADRSGGNNAARPQTTAAANKGVVGSSASEILRQHRNLDPRFLGIVVTDENGTVVAATQPPPKPSLAEDEQWQAAYNKGQGAVKISDIVDDELTKSYYVNISVPVGDPSSQRLIGVLTAAVNITPVLSLFQNPIGNGAQAELVDEQGSVIAGRKADPFARVKSPEFDTLRDSVGPLQGRLANSQVASVRGAPYIVGFASTGLKQQFDNLGWVAIVSEEEHQATAAIRGLERFAVLMVVLALFMLTLLCVYYFLHRSQKFEDMEEALPPDQRRAATASS